MYYTQRLTRSGVALYQAVPNQSPVPGGIALPETLARQLWNATKVGVRVIITNGDIPPASVSNPRLFARKLAPAEPTAEATATSARIESAHNALAAGQKRATGASGGDSALDAMASTRPTPRDSRASSSEVVRSAYDIFDFSKARRNRAEAAAPAAPAEVVRARPLRPGPLSVFISRKEGRLFVRKGFEPVFSTPVTFDQPDRPLGTHVFTAITPNEDDSERWNVVTIPTYWPRSPVRARNGELASVGKPSTAVEAFERVKIPQDAVDRISELISEGASVIISDLGLGPETSNGTDFVILTQ
jgi:hypothetical protein